MSTSWGWGNCLVRSKVLFSAVYVLIVAHAIGAIPHLSWQTYPAGGTVFTGSTLSAEVRLPGLDGPVTLRLLRDEVPVWTMENVDKVSVPLAYTFTSPNSSGSYWLEAENSDGKAQTAPKPFIVLPRTTPVIFWLSPSGAKRGDTLSASVSEAELQWLENGVPIPGAIYPQYTIPTNGQGPYQLRATYGQATHLSAPIRVSEILLLKEAPFFWNHPRTHELREGDPYEVRFDYSIYGGNDDQNTEVKEFWNEVLQSKPYIDPSVRAVPAHAGTFRVEVKNTVGEEKSSIARLIIQPRRARAPTLVEHPASRSVGSSVAYRYLTVKYESSTPPQFQWRLNGTPISGATSAEYMLSAAAPDSERQYDVVVTNEFGSVTSQRAIVDRPGSQGYRDAFALHPASIAADVGSPAHFSVTIASQYRLDLPSGSSLSARIHWERNEIPLPDSAHTQLNLASIRSEDFQATYRAVLTFTDGTIVRSREATLSELSKGFSPEIKVHPGSVTTLLNSPVEFAVEARGQAPLSFEWRRNGDVIAGATGPVLKLAGATQAVAGNYSVRVSNALGSAISESAVLSVRPAAAPRVFQQPNAEIAVYAGSTRVLAQILMTAPEAYSYQWYRDDVLLAGETQDAIRVDYLEPFHAGRYHVKVTNAAGVSLVSEPALVRLVPGEESPGFALQPQGKNLSAGDTYTLTAHASGLKRDTVLPSDPSPLRYQWYLNGVAIDGANGNTLLLPRVTPDSAGTYHVEAFDGVKRAISEPASIVVTPRNTSPQLPFVVSSTDGHEKSFNAGSHLVLAPTLVGAQGYTYEWTLDGAPLVTSRQPTLEFPRLLNSHAGTYSLVVRGPAGVLRVLTSTITVQGKTSGVPRFMVGLPEKVEVGYGHTVTIIPELEDDRGSPVWLREGVVLSNSSPVLNLTESGSAEVTGQYELKVKDEWGTVSDTGFKTTVSRAPVSVAGAYAGTLNTRFNSSTAVPDGVVAWIRPNGSGILLSYTAPEGRPYPSLTETLSLDGSGAQTLTIQPLPSSTVELPRTVSLKADGTRLRATNVYPIALNLERQVRGNWTSYAGYFKGSVPEGTLHAVLTAAGHVGLLVDIKDAPQGLYAQLTGESSSSISNTTHYSRIEVRHDKATHRLIGVLVKPSGATIPFSLERLEKMEGGLVNVSARGFSGPGELSLTAGIIVVGNPGQKPFLIRGIGPTLGNFFVPDFMEDTQLSIYAGPQVIANNQDWHLKDADAIITASAQSGAFPLPDRSSDAALVMPLNTGLYTALVNDPTGKPGVALIEAYDIAPRWSETGIRFKNLSSRGWVGTGGNVLVAGFSIGGDLPRRLLIRGAGPSLKPLGVQYPLADPVLRIYRNGALIAANQDWIPGDVQQASSDVGAFAFAASSKDAALVLTLPPGGYTAIVSGMRETVGIALIEVYELD